MFKYHSIRSSRLKDTRKYELSNVLQVRGLGIEKRKSREIQVEKAQNLDEEKSPLVGKYYN